MFFYTEHWKNKRLSESGSKDKRSRCTEISESVADMPHNPIYIFYQHVLRICRVPGTLRPRWAKEDKAHSPFNSSSQIGSEACHSPAARRLEDCCAGGMWTQGGGTGKEMELVGQRGALVREDSGKRKDKLTPQWVGSVSRQRCERIIDGQSDVGRGACPWKR